MPAETEPTPNDSRLARLLRLGFAVFIVAIVLALHPHTAYPSGPIKQLIMHWSAFVLGAAWLAGTFIAKEPVRKPAVFFELTLLFLVFNLIAAMFSSHVSNSMVHVRTLFSYVVLYLVASHVYRTPTQFRRFLFVTCAAVACSTAYAFCQRYGLDPFPWADRSAVEYKELPGTFGNPNYAAHMLILCIIISVYLAWSKRTFWCAGFTALFLVHMYFAHQRGGLVALAAAGALCVLALFIRRLVKRPARTAAMTLTVFVLMGLVGAGGIMTLTKLRTGSAFPIDESLMLRYHSFFSAARMAKDRPLFGFGPGNYEIHNAAYWTDYEQRWFAEGRMMNSHVHNDVLETAIDAGLPAAGLYLGILLGGIVFGLAMGRSEDAVRRRLGFLFAAFFCAYLVDGLFGFNSRVPVTGVLLFVMAGGMEGLWRPGEAPCEERKKRSAWLAAAWRAGVLLVGLVIVVVETRTFVGELARYWGRSHLKGNSLQGAAYYFTKGARLMPWDWLFPLEEGRVYQHEDKAEPALRCFERSLRLNPNYLPTAVAVAHAQFEQSLTLLNENQRDTSTSEAAAASKAVAARVAERLDTCDTHALQALALCPMLPEAHDILGRSASIRASLLPVLAAAGGGEKAAPTDDAAIKECWSKAEEHLALAARYGARNPARVNTMLAEARVALGELEAAEEAYVHALQAEPGLKETWQRFYRFAQTNKRVDTVGGQLADAIHEMEIQPKKDAGAIASMYMWRALLEAELNKNPEAAVTAFRQAVRYAPSREDIWSAFALFAADAKKRPALENTVLEAAQRCANEKKAPIPAVAAVATLLQGGSGSTESLEKASALLLDAVEKTPDTEDRKRVVAVGWAAEIVFAAVQKAGPSFPGWEATMMNLGRTMAAIKAYDAAQYVLGSAMPRLSIDDKTECAQLRAHILVDQKRYDDAIQVLQAASAQGAKREPIHLELARTLAKAGRNQEARQVYQSLLKSDRLTGDGRRIVQQEHDALPK